MAKRRPAFDPRQMDLGFEVPESDPTDGALADLPRFTSSLVAAILKRDPRSRFEVAADMSRLLGDEVTKWTLDAYCSEAKDQHRIPFDRMLALVAATSSHDLLARAMHRIGADLLVGEEVALFEIGHLESLRKRVDSRLRMLKAEARPADRGGRQR